MIDTEIEVFRAGSPASRGITAERLAPLAEFDCEANPIPICIGHPKSDDPAHGAIKGFRLDGNSLFARVANVSSKIVEGIKDGSILNRSMAFFGEDHEANPTPGKLAPRHLGFLGAAAPGIPGMQPLSKALAFAADDDENLLVEAAPAEAILFEAEPTAVLTIFQAKEPEMSVLTPEQIAERENALTRREEAIAARLKTQFDASNNGAIDALVLAGKVTPAEATDLKLAFGALDPEGEELTFGAGDNTTTATAASKILSFMATALGRRIPTGDRISPSGEFDATGDAPKSAADFNSRVDALVKEKGMTFDAAAEQVAEQMGA